MPRIHPLFPGRSRRPSERAVFDQLTVTPLSGRRPSERAGHVPASGAGFRPRAAGPTWGGHGEVVGGSTCHRGEWRAPSGADAPLGITAGGGGEGSAAGPVWRQRAVRWSTGGRPSLPQLSLLQHVWPPISASSILASAHTHLDEASMLSVPQPTHRRPMSVLANSSRPAPHVPPTPVSRPPPLSRPHHAHWVPSQL